jgi:hypothetical protein
VRGANEHHAGARDRRFGRLPAARWLGAIPFCAQLLLVGPSEAQEWSILHHDIEAFVEPAGNRLEVTDQLQLSKPPDRMRPLHLLLHRDLQVDSVLLSGRSLEMERAQGFQPRHFWRRPDYERMDDYAIATELTVQPPPGGWPADPRLSLRYAGAVYDSLRPPEVAYSRGFETTTGLVDSRGAYLAGSTFWLPWRDERPFRYRLRVHVPVGWESISQGTWAERKVTQEERVESTWVADDPMDDAYLIAGPYVVREKSHGDVQVYTFTYENTPEELCRTYLDATGDYLDLYEELIGPYPFDKFAMVENWWQTGYGMPSFTLLGDRVIRLPFIVHTSYGHEILHNWWGNGVFVDEAHGNWSEGLTTYLADYTYKARESDAAAREYRLAQLQGYLDYASSGGRDFPLRRFTQRENPSTQAVGYGKTMMIFHMLRRHLGDELFFAGLRHFYAEHLFQKASWDDVVGSFETVSDQPLADWFEQWIDRAGAPLLSVTGDFVDAGGWIELQQTNPLYELRVPVHTNVDGELHVQVVPLHNATARLELPAGTRWVAADPDFEIFRKLHRDEVPPALSQVLGADSTIVVIGSRCAPDVAAALRDLAADWSRNHDQVVVEEANFDDSRGRGVWLFGAGEHVDALFDATRAFGDAPSNLRKKSSAEGLSLVASFREPDDPQVPWTVVLPAEASVVAALGRKLPHYGRYSYLLFERETNVEKGSWVVESSPLRLDFAKE